MAMKKDITMEKKLDAVLEAVQNKFFFFSIFIKQSSKTTEDKTKTTK